MEEFTIFKIGYIWYEGEESQELVGKAVTKEEFEQDLLSAQAFAESLKGKEIKNHDYLGKGYSVECLPEFYEQIIWFLINKKGYINCFFDDCLSYKIDDDHSELIGVQREEQRIIKQRLENNSSINTD